MICEEDMLDTVFIEKADGTREGPYRTNLSPTLAIIFRSDVDIIDGEILIRVMQAREERYQILLAHFTQTTDQDIPSHWNLTLRKETALSRTPPTSKNTTVNIHQSSGIQVGDYNSLTIGNAVSELIQRIDEAQATPEQKATAKGKLSELLSHPLVSSIVGAAVTGLIEGQK